MNGQKRMSSFIRTLLVLALFYLLPIDGQMTCPWCNKKLQMELVNCVYIDMISQPQMMSIPVRDIDNIKWKLLSDSDSMVGLSNEQKKVAMDDKFIETMASSIKQSGKESDPATIDAVSGLAGNCYSSVTGIDPNVVKQDIKKMVNDKLKRNAVPLREDPNPFPNSGMPYSADQNKQNNFQPSYVNNAPFKPPPSPPVNSFNNPSYDNNTPFNPFVPFGSQPANFNSPSNRNGALFNPGFPSAKPFNNHPIRNDPYKPPASPSVNSFNNPSNRYDPFKPPVSPPVNTFNGPSNMNDAPFKPPISPPVNSFNSPSNRYDPFKPPISPPVNSFNGPSNWNDAPFKPPVSPAVNSFNGPSNRNDVSFKPPVSPPVNSFNGPSNWNDAPFKSPVSPPVNSFNYPSNRNDAPFKPPVSPPINSFNGPLNMNDAPFKPPVYPAVNSFNGPSNRNDASFEPHRSPQVIPSNGNDFPFKSSGSQTANYFNNPSNGNDDLFNPTTSTPMNPSNNISPGNYDIVPSKNWQENNYHGQEQTESDSSRNQAPSSGVSGENDGQFQSNRNSMDNVFETTTPPKYSSPPEDSKSFDLVSSDSSKWTTSSPHTDVSQTKTTGDENSDDEPCDEKFKNALFDKLIDDDRFNTYLKKNPVSSTKPAVLKMMDHAFREYGIQQHYKEFTAFWKMPSQKLNNKSKVEDWAEVISKICHIIFSRNDLIKGDCEEIGCKIADYILDAFPEDPMVSNTKTPNENDNTSAESTATTNAYSENNFNPQNSTNSEDLSFPEMHSKLTNTFNHDGSTEQDSDEAPLYETLSAFEVKQNLETLHSAAKSCLSPSGFDFSAFYSNMSDVTDSIQKNHPNWSREKCEKEMYSETVAVLAELLQDTVKSKSNSESQSSSNQPGSNSDSSASQSTDSDAEDDYYEYPDDSSYPDAEYDYESDSANQPQDLINYGEYPDESEPVNAPSYENQPDFRDEKIGLTQSLQNAPSYDYDYGLKNYGLANEQPKSKNFPSQNYPAIPPTNRNSQAYSETQAIPVNQNAGIQQPSGVAPNSRFANSPNYRNSQSQSYQNYDYSAPDAGPVIPNGNSQNFQPQPYQNRDYNVPALGPVIPNGNSQNFQPQTYQNQDYRAPGQMIPNGNSQNFQPQPYQNRDYNVPAPGPVIPNGNSQNFQPQPFQNQDYRAPVAGPAVLNDNSQTGYNPNFNSRAPDNGRW